MSSSLHDSYEGYWVAARVGESHGEKLCEVGSLEAGKTRVEQTLRVIPDVNLAAVLKRSEVLTIEIRSTLGVAWRANWQHSTGWTTRTFVGRFRASTAPSNPVTRFRASPCGRRLVRALVDVRSPG